MKRIVIVLISAIAVFFCTLLFSNLYISNKSREAADRLNTEVVKEFGEDLNAIFEGATNVVRSFLSGDFYCFEDPDSKVSELVFYIPDSGLRDFKEMLDESMEDFLRVNTIFDRTIFFVDDSISALYPHYGFHSRYAVTMGCNDDETREIRDIDFMHSKSYNYVKSTHKCLWALPSPETNIDHKTVVYYVPIFCQDGRFFGSFVFTIDAELFRKVMTNHLPFGKEDSRMVICDKDGRIVVSSPDDYEKYDSVQSLSRMIGNTSIAELADSVNVTNRTKLGSENYFLYMRHIPISDWYVKTACREAAVYREVAHIRWIVFLTSFVGMALMLLCGVVISRQVRKDLRQKAIAENEIQMAASVQASMLKDPHFVTDNAELNAFLRPAREAGGDLYGYVKNGDDLIFCIGDVSGKGMPAALFMTQVVSLFRNAVHETSNPSEIVSKMNDVLCENNPNMTFCTYFVGVLSGSRLTYCNAGHNSPVLLRKGVPAEYINMHSNIALGIIESFPFEVDCLELNQGDALLLYTDGVTEAKNKQDEYFGESRLLTTLNGCTQDAIGATLSAVEAFVGKYEQSDDITLLHICR